MLLPAAGVSLGGVQWHLSWDTEVGLRHLEMRKGIVCRADTSKGSHVGGNIHVLIQGCSHFPAPADLILTLPARFLIPRGSDSVDLGWGLRLCIANTFPGGADGPQTTCWVALLWIQEGSTRRGPLSRGPVMLGYCMEFFSKQRGPALCNVLYQVTDAIWVTYWKIPSGGSDSKAMQETWVRSLSWEDLLEKEVATHSSTLAWKIPWMEEPGTLQSMGSPRVGHWLHLLWKINLEGPLLDRPAQCFSECSPQTTSSICIIWQLVRNLNPCFPHPPDWACWIRSWAQGPAVLVLTSPLGYSDAYQSLRTTGLDGGETGNGRQGKWQQGQESAMLENPSAILSLAGNQGCSTKCMDSGAIGLDLDSGT